MTRVIIAIKWPFVILALHLWTLGSASIGKCCPSGDTLVIDLYGNFSCQDRPEVGRELIDLRQTRNVVSEGLPHCSTPRHVQVRLPDAAEKVPEGSCLEVLHDSRDDFPVLVYCGDGDDLGSEKLPGILKVRKCCPTGVYDSGACVHGEPRSFGRDVEFIDVYGWGAPKCNLLVDYKLNLEEDVYYAGAGNGVQVTISLDGVRKNVFIDPATSCLDSSLDSGSLALRLCSAPDYCETNPCVRKRCFENEFGHKDKCLGTGPRSLLPEFRASLADLAAQGISALPQNYGLLFGKPCKNVFVPEPDEPWSITSRGELIFDDTILNHSQYYLELRNVSGHQEFAITAYICLEDRSDSAEVHAPSLRYKYIIVGSLGLISSAFLLATLLVYSCLPSLQNLHGKTLMCHVGSLFFAYACLGINGIIEFRELSDGLCRYLAYTMILSFDSAFFWLNVMCFDIWWTFGGMRGGCSGASAADKRRNERSRFLTYCLYAWGLALGLTLASAVFDYLGQPPPGKNIGIERCWYSYKSTAEVVLFFVPISVTLIVNTGLFVSTSHRCGKVQAEIKKMMAKDVKDPKTRKFHSDKTRLILNIKLFIVMGVPWLLENGQAYLMHYLQVPLWFQEALFVVDVANSLMGLWIFILFVLKPKVYVALRKRFTGSQPSSSSSKSTSSALRVNQQNTTSLLGSA